MENLQDETKYCFYCAKYGHSTEECWSTRGLNTPEDRELARIINELHRYKQLYATYLEQFLPHSTSESMPMFGTNEIVGKKFFENSSSDSLYVTSIFYTIQGEGPYSGIPCVFLRLGKCNLACQFCDTLFDQGEWMTFAQIEQKIYTTICDYWNSRGQPVPLWMMPNYQSSQFFGPYGCGLIITGGEPSLQAPNLINFLRDQMDTFEEKQIETNGILQIDLPKDLKDEIVLVVSPKCKEKDGKPTEYLKPNQAVLEKADCLKFVMSADQSSPYSSIPDWADKWLMDKLDQGEWAEIYVSPMNVYNEVPKKIRLVRKDNLEVSLDIRSTVDEVVSFWEPGLLNMDQNRLNHEYTANYCLAHGYRFNLQAHLYAGLA